MTTLTSENTNIINNKSEESPIVKTSKINKDFTYIAKIIFKNMSNKPQKLRIRGW